MQKLQQSYAAYFNQAYGDSIKCGQKMPVFEGRFQAKEVDDESYYQQLVLYVELNALKHGLIKDGDSWPYASGDSDQSPRLPDDFVSDFL